MNYFIALDEEKSGEFKFFLDPQYIPDVKNIKFDPFGDDVLMLNMEPSSPIVAPTTPVEVKYDPMWCID